jgi:hypothetical protein
MIHVSENNAAPATPINLHDRVGSFVTWVAAVVGVTRASVDKIDAAHALRCHRASFLVEGNQDTGIDPSDATGIAAWQPDLPFFMQSGFGQK